MFDHARTPMIGEDLLLTKDKDNYVFLNSVKYPEIELVLDLGWEFEFNEPLQYLDGRGKTVSVSSRRAHLIAEGEFTVFAFNDGQRVKLEDIVLTGTLRIKRVSSTVT